jgi:hypothetical protein
MVLVVGALVVAAAPSAAGAAPPGFTWTGGATSSDWSNAANWAGGSAPAGSVGTLGFPDVPACDTTTPPTTCHYGTDDIAGLAASGLDFSGGPYVMIADAADDPLTIGAGGITVSASTSGSSSYPSAEYLAMPLDLDASQSWTLSGPSSGFGTELDTAGDVAGAGIDAHLSNGAMLLLGGASNEVASFAATGANPDATGVVGGTATAAASTNGSVALVTATGGSGDLNGTNGEPVTLTNVAAEGAATIGALDAKGALVTVGNGTSSPGVLSVGAATFDPTSGIQMAIVGAATTPGDGASELVGSPNAANPADTGTVDLGGAELELTTSSSTSGTSACYTPASVGATYTLVSAPRIVGQFSVLDPATGTSTVPLVNGGTVALPSCTGGQSPYALEVTYHLGTTPNTVTGTVVGATTTTVTTAPAASNDIPYGNDVTYSATVSSVSGTGTPTGTVTFEAHPILASGTTPALATELLGPAVPLCQYTLAAASSCTSAAAPAGADDIVAVYTPDAASAGTFGGSAGSLSLSVLYQTSVAVAASSPTPSAGQPVTYTVTVDDTSPTTGSVPPVGSATVLVGGDPVCSAAVFPTGVANQSEGSCTTADTPAEGSLLVATFEPNTDGPLEVGPFAPAISGQSTIAAAASASMTTITAPTANASVAGASTVTYGVSVASASGAGPTPTGTVEIFAGGVANGSAAGQVLDGEGIPGLEEVVPLCTVTLAAGSGTCQSSAAPIAALGGSEALTAVYSGDSTYGGSFATESIDVTGSTFGVLVGAATPTVTTAGGAVTYTAAVYETATAGTSTPASPTGTVTFTVGGQPLCQATLAPRVAVTLVTSDAVASCQSASAPVGDDTVLAGYGGDPTNGYGGAAEDVPVAVVELPQVAPTATAAATTTALGASPAATTYGQPIAYTATVTAASGPVSSGTVTFTDGAATLCSAVAVTGGTATCSTTATPVGQAQTVTAAYSPGASSSLAGSSASASVTVAPAPSPTPTPSPSPTPTPPSVAGTGYRLVGADGGVFALGGASFSGSLGGVRLAAPIVGAASDPCTGGYWLAGADGGVFAFDAPFAGSLGGVHLAAPIVGIASYVQDGAGGEPVSCGYWLVGADGGVFGFDAPFAGSLGGVHLAAPIVGMAADPVTGGYWLVGSDGGVFGFDAPFAGSLGGHALAAPVIGIATGTGADQSLGSQASRAVALDPALWS